MNEFSIGNVLTAGWTTFTRNYLGLLIVAVIYTVITSVPTIILSVTNFNEDPLGNIGWIIAAYVYIFFTFGPAYAGLFYSGYQAFRGELEPAHALAGFGNYFRIMLMTVVLVVMGAGLYLAALVVIVPLALIHPALIIAAVIPVLIAFVYFALRLFVFPWIIVVDRKSGPIQSISISWRITKGRVLQLFVCYVVAIIAVFVVSVPFFIPVMMAVMEDPAGAEMAMQDPKNQLWFQIPGVLFSFPFLASFAGAAFGLIVGRSVEEHATVFE